jgi:hypothetical protein
MICLTVTPQKNVVGSSILSVQCTIIYQLPLSKESNPSRIKHNHWKMLFL